MRAILIILLSVILAFTAAAGDLVLKNKANGAELRLMDSPCSHGETLALLKEEYRAQFKNARILDAKGHISFYGCWTQEGDDTAVVILSDGAAMGFALSTFSDPML